jgi:hypothetical protein
MFDKAFKKYFTNEDGVFEVNEHVDKFAVIYAGIIFASCIFLKMIGVI